MSPTTNRRLSDQSTDLSLDDIQPFNPFAQQCEREGTATVNQLRWWSRYRNENGLLSSGAIVEKRPNPGSKRPLLFFVKSRFVRWLSSTDGGAV